VEELQIQIHDGLLLCMRSVLQIIFAISATGNLRINTVSENLGFEEFSPQPEEHAQLWRGNKLDAI